MYLSLNDIGFCHILCCVYWCDHTIFIFQSVNIWLTNVWLISNFKPTLHSQDKLYLVIIFFIHCWVQLAKFLKRILYQFMKNVNLKFSFFYVPVWLWYHSNASFIEWVGEAFRPLYLSGSVSVEFLLFPPIEFTNKAIWT